MKKTILAFNRVSPRLLEPYKDKYNIIVMRPELGDTDAQFQDAIPSAHGPIGGNRRNRETSRILAA